ncbi:hypothetical protein ADUPG1_002706, partial [Aduncisulcus paluster]
VTTLSVQNNTSFAPTSTSVFPSSLTSLDISGCTSFAPPSTSVFPSSLTSLDISGCTSITALDVLPTTLTELYINGLEFSNKSNLSGFTSLTTLSANDCGILDSDLFHLYLLPAIQVLSLKNNELTDVSLLFNLKNTLDYLYVNGNRICNISPTDYPASITFGVDNQDDTLCNECPVSSSYPSVDFGSNTICDELWSAKYETN